ncbi:hypothetical protein [Candidatus Nephthysia bennettiae]
MRMSELLRERPPLQMRVLDLLHDEHAGRREVFPCSRSWLIRELGARYDLRASQRQVRKALDLLLSQPEVLVVDRREKRKGSPGRPWVLYRFGRMGSALRPAALTRGVSASESREEVGSR